MHTTNVVPSAQETFQRPETIPRYRSDLVSAKSSGSTSLDVQPPAPIRGYKAAPPQNTAPLQKPNPRAASRPARTPPRTTPLPVAQPTHQAQAPTQPRLKEKQQLRPTVPLPVNVDSTQAPPPSSSLHQQHHQPPAHVVGTVQVPSTQGTTVSLPPFSFGGGSAQPPPPTAPVGQPPPAFPVFSHVPVAAAAPVQQVGLVLCILFCVYARLYFCIMLVCISVYPGCTLYPPQHIM